MQQPRIFFAVALHEKYALPTDALYTPIQAGAAIHPPLGLMRDDTGENISAKNGGCGLVRLVPLSAVLLPPQDRLPAKAHSDACAAAAPA